MKLGIRNVFNIPAKFILLFAVFFFLCSGTIVLYASVHNMGNESENGWNQYFSDTSRERLIVTRTDRKEFKEKDYEKIRKLNNVDRIIKNDLSLEASYAIRNDDLYSSILLSDIKGYEKRLEKGRLPKERNEAVFLIPEGSYLGEQITSFFEKEVNIYDDNTGNIFLKDKLKIVGYGYLSREEGEQLSNSRYREGILCVGENTMEQVCFLELQRFCSHEITFVGSVIKGNMENHAIIPSDWVPEGQMYIPEDIKNLTSYWPVGMSISLKIKSLYFEDSYDMTVGIVYNRDNLKYYLDREDYEDIEGSIFVSYADYKKMFSKGNFQSTVMVMDKSKLEQTKDELESMGLTVFPVHDGLVSYSANLDALLKVLRTLLLGAGLLILFFVSYFIIRLILKSRNQYYSTVRMLGGTRNNCRGLLRTDLFAVFNIAFLVSCVFVCLVKYKVLLGESYLYQMLVFLKPADFILLYVLLALVSLLLARRYARKLFGDSAMNVYREVA